MPEILKLVKQMDDEAKAIKKEVLQLCWYMRGLSFTEGMYLSYDERQIISEIIKNNLETTKKSGMPFF